MSLKPGAGKGPQTDKQTPIPFSESTVCPNVVCLLTSVLIDNL